MAKSIRNTEARKGAKILGAQFHARLMNDLEILYTTDLLRAVAAVIREVKPTVVLTHSPQDYMEDHMTASRLAVTAAFARGMPNFKTTPARPAADYDVTVYHGMPHGLCDNLRRRIIPGAFVNTTAVQKLKREALAAHKSQQGWLDTSQGLNSFLLAMENMAMELGRMSKKFKCAEGWRRHLHLGFCGPEADPLEEALGKNFLINEAYEREPHLRLSRIAHARSLTKPHSMPRKLSSIAPDWWDYTTLDDDIIRDAAALTPEKMLKLSRPGLQGGPLRFAR